MSTNKSGISAVGQQQTNPGEKALDQLDVEKIIQELNALQPNKKKGKELLFEKLCPAVEAALGRSVTQREILMMLEKNGLKLSPNTLRVMLQNERKRLAEMSAQLGAT